MSDNTTERTYCLVESGIFERLLKTYFMLAHTLLLFEHLCSHSDRPMFLSARKVCEALGLDRNKLEQYRRKRIIKARAVNGQMMYSAYDLIALMERLQRRKIQRILSATARFVIR
ncbi:helix-turn-helix domain-containing protein [Alistipes putredinis]|uniref:helix-turn-helix domain-containing protein n=1 Tax=Alistipes putredinis TaxID=28117 RepID=UPI003AB7D1B8